MQLPEDPGPISVGAINNHDGDASVLEDQARLAVWHAAFARLPQIMWTARKDGFVEYVNESGLEYLGVPLDRLTGWSWLEFVHPADRERVMQNWIDSTMDGRAMEITYRMLTKTGRYNPNLVRAQPVQDRTGTVVSYVGSHTDLENLEQTQKALSSANMALEQMEAILAIYETESPVAYAFLDRNLQLTRVNARFREIAGAHSSPNAQARTLNELLGQNGPMATHAAAAARDTRSRKVGLVFHKESQAPQQPVRRWQASFHPVITANDVCGVVVIGTELPTGR